MFVGTAIADFSSQTLKNSQIDQKQKQSQQKQQNNDRNQKNERQDEAEDDKVSKQKQQDQQQQAELKSKKRNRTEQQNRQLERYNQSQDNQQKAEQQQQQANQDIKYLNFQTGDKILVRQTYQNGWWFGNIVGKPQQLGFFPSNYVKIGPKPPAPPPPSKKPQKNQEEKPEYDPNDGIDWIKKQLNQIEAGPIKSDYYQGIKGYKMVKIDEKNQNILKGNHVQFDVATGIARVPVKDQAPTAKAVRQMGYYFDYHQWNETMNQNPHKKARPDPRKKKPKTLKLKMMD